MTTTGPRSRFLFPVLPRGGWPAAALVLLLSACATSAPLPAAGRAALSTTPPHAISSAAALEDAATLRVTNRSWGPVEVWLLSGTRRLRLGRVRSWKTESFRLPRGGAAEAQLLVDSMGAAAAATSEPFRLAAAREVEWTIQEPVRLAVTTLRVRF